MIHTSPLPCAVLLRVYVFVSYNGIQRVLYLSVVCMCKCRVAPRAGRVASRQTAPTFGRAIVCLGSAIVQAYPAPGMAE